MAGVIVVAALAGAGRSRRARLELAGLIVFFALVEPVFAIGIYFIAWHSWRHILRLATIQPAARAALQSGHGAQAIGRVLLAALPCTALAVAGMAIFGALLAGHLLQPAGAVAIALAVIAALTVPHTLLVAWLDRQQPGAGRA
jgi:Brp/Blh family beta-carotene 15,15'-monooxygenase